MKHLNILWRIKKRKYKRVVQATGNEDKALQFYIDVVKFVSPAGKRDMTAYDFINKAVVNDAMYTSCLSILPLEFSGFVACKYHLWAEDFAFRMRLALQRAIGHELTLISMLKHIHFADDGEDWDFNIDKYLDDIDCRHDSKALCEEIIRQCLKAYDIDILRCIEDTMAGFDTICPKVRQFWNSKKMEGDYNIYYI